MNILIICLFIAAIAPYLAKIPLVYAMNQAGGYNNNYPREQQASLQGFGARALGAHQNSFESLLIFSTAILTALATHTISPFIQGLAIVHIVSRLFYHIFYLMNWATLRSSIWAIGVLCSLIILGLCIH